MSRTTLLLVTFSFEIILLCQNSIRIYQILNFKFQITQTNSMKKWQETKIVGLNEFYNFVVYDFFIWRASDAVAEQRCRKARSEYVRRRVPYFSNEGRKVLFIISAQRNCGCFATCVTETPNQ
jgi:hypothetical protein